MDIMDEIKDLKAKKEQAQTLLTKYRTQLETLAEEKATLVKELADKYNATPETAKEKLATMLEKRDELLASAKDILDKIPTKS